MVDVDGELRRSSEFFAANGCHDRFRRSNGAANPSAGSTDYIYKRFIGHLITPSERSPTHSFSEPEPAVAANG